MTANAGSNGRANRQFWAAAVGLPVLSHGLSFVVNVGDGAWWPLPTAVRWSLAGDAILYTVGGAVIAAPLAGVVASANGAAGRLAARWGATGTLTVAALLFAVTSGLLTLGWSAGREDAVTFVLRSHATLLAVTLTLAAGGAVAAAWLRDPLDAAAVSLLAALLGTVGLLVAGAAAADVPESMIALGLAASPLVAVASAAHIDIVRMDLLYQISPLAHMRMDYPSWYGACAGYLTVALACFAGLTWKHRMSQPALRGRS